MISSCLALRVAPKSASDAIVGWHGEALKVKVRAAPENGKANAAVIALLATTLGVPQKAISLESGQASRNKRVRITGLTIPAVQAQITAAIAGANKRET